MSTATIGSSGSTAAIGAPTTDTSTVDSVIQQMDNTALIIRLQFTINHLSRWLTPIHDQQRLERSRFRGEPSVKEIMLAMRDEEARIFPKLHLMAVKTNPNLDKLPEPVRTDADRQADRQRSPLGVMAELRRLRQSTTSLLRSMPDAGWARGGISRREHDWTIRQLAEHLARHDYHHLALIDETLDRTGAREGLAAIQRVHLDELLKLSPTKMSPHS